MPDFLEQMEDAKDFGTENQAIAFGEISTIDGTNVWVVLPRAAGREYEHGPIVWEHSSSPTIGDSVLVIFDDANKPWITAWEGAETGGGALGLPIAETDVTGLVSDLAAKAPTASPTFTGDPKAPTPLTADNDTSIATTAYVKAQGYITSAPVSSVFGRTGAVVATSGDYSVAQVTGAAPLTSPTFTGVPAAPTPLTADNSTTVATTAFVKAQGYITSAPVSSVFGRTGAVVATSGDYSVAQVTGAAPLTSPTFTGVPAAPTPLTADNSTTIATTAFVKAQGYLTTNAVSSVFGRTGAVVAASGDYSVAQVTGAAADTAVVHNTGAETVAGVKTFTGTPVFPADSISKAYINGLSAAADFGLVYVSTVSALAVVSPVAPGSFLASKGVGGIPAYVAGKLVSSSTVILNGTTSYVAPTNCTMLYIEAQGAGGGGGGAPAASTTTCSVGGGGGSGAYAEKVVSANIGTHTVAVGAAGLAGTTGANAGGAGGDTSFNDTVPTAVCVAKGGGGGPAGVTAAATALIQAGGVAGAAAASTGDFKLDGENPDSMRMSGTVGISRGAAAPCGGGAQFVQLSAAGAVGGASARQYGGGGAGGVNISTGTVAGGAGGLGVMRVWAYTSG